jgi:adenine-specific DNA glycosylase
VRSVEELWNLWSTMRVRGKTFGDFESALVRLGRDFCRRQRWADCPMHEYCGAGAVHREGLKARSNR